MNRLHVMVKNASLLYFRMMLTMIITLYTSRVVLQILGVVDYGIYSVVSGFITILSFLHAAMSSATQRFITFELGKELERDVKKIFSMSMNIHILIAILVLLISETLGLWFLRNKMNIPIDRLTAAETVFHFTVFSLMVTIIRVPYSALIIAHEKMNIFAWISILDVSLKLFIVYILKFINLDHLSGYAVLSFSATLIIYLIYKVYCNFKYIDSRYKPLWDYNLFRTMLSFTSWSLWGNIAVAISNQGVNILLNIFFGPSVNAARAFSMQVSGALNSFMQSLQVAVNPQIIKAYANNETTYMHQLVSYSSKYNFFLILIFSTPLLIYTDKIIDLWLSNAPKLTTEFVKLIIINVLIDALSAPLITSAQATGKIKLYQSIVGGTLLLNLPLSYIIIVWGGQPYTVVIASISVSIIALILRLILISGLIDLSVPKFFTNALLPCIIVSLITFVTVYYLMRDALQYLYFINPYNILALLLNILIIILTVLIISFIFGLSKNEKAWIVKVIYKIKT